MLANALISYDPPKDSKKQYIDVCERCGKEFMFSAKDVKNRVITCPNCGYTMIFFTFAGYDN